MDRINLIPQARQHARRRRVRTRLWIGLALSYAVSAAGLSAVYRGASSSHDLASLLGELAAYEAELTQLDNQQNSLRPQLSEQTLILAAERSISDQPDWSLLLTYLAGEVLGDQVVLSGCELAPATPGQGTNEADAIDDAPLTLTLTGYARTTPDVSRFILRLERVGLFDKVTLTRTNREPYLSGQAIAFEARCLMKRGGGGQ